MKHPVLETPEYTIFFEEFWLGPIVHINIHAPWTKALKAEVRNVSDRLFERWGPLWVAHYPEQGVKQRKFLSMMGFSPCGRFTRTSGEKVDFYSRLH